MGRFERRTDVVRTIENLATMAIWAIYASINPDWNYRWVNVVDDLVVLVARRGEILGLGWADIDLERGVVSITGSLGKNLTKGRTKTKRSVRTVTLDPDTLAAVRAWRTRAAERALAAGGPLGPWVVSDDPTCAVPWRPDVATKRMRRMLDLIGIPGARLNDLRHAHITWLLENGVSPRTVADRVGHAKVSTTIDTYGHILAGADEAAAAAFAAVSRR